jgi:hypothetical protein
MGNVEPLKKRIKELEVEVAFLQAKLDFQDGKNQPQRKGIMNEY